MAAPKVMSGARAKVFIIDPATQQSTLVGIFSTISYGVTYDVAEVAILGRYSAAELEYVGMTPVSISATGWRVIHQGPHVAGRLPRLQDLISHEYLEMAIIDRQDDTRIAKLRKVRPSTYTTSLNAKQLEELTLTFVAILVDDEDTENNETANATFLPDVP